MIVADTSALISVLFAETGADAYLATMNQERTLISAGTLIEASVVAQKTFGAKGAAKLNRLLEDIGADIVAVDWAQGKIAQEAFARFGKGMGTPPAALNFGDCFAYALAKAMDAPLLYKGDDFSKTDVKRVHT